MKNFFSIRKFSLVFLFILFFILFGIKNSTANLQTDIGGYDEEIEDIQDNLESKKKHIDELKKQSEIYRQNIVKKRKEIVSLQNQLEILDEQIIKTNIDITTKEQEIELVNLEIKKLEKNIKEQEKAIEAQKEKITEILQRIHRNDEVSHLEILLSNDSLSDFFKQAKFLENLENSLHFKLQNLKEFKEDLDNALVLQESKKLELTNLKDDLENQKIRLESEERIKTNLIRDTQTKESKFQSLLKQLKAEEEAIDSDIVNLEKELRKKLREKEDLEKLGHIASGGLIWPVPMNKITSTFHDPDYPYRYIMEHPAIDIRAKQGTVVKAAATGYVARTRRDLKCTGRYSYIMLIHADGIATVYGHLSQIDAEEGQFVAQNQRIGLSGAMPGTCGSGRLTTGPHMHFEVRKNGIPVDPMGYLR